MVPKPCTQREPAACRCWWHGSPNRRRRPSPRGHPPGGASRRRFNSDLSPEANYRRHRSLWRTTHLPRFATAGQPRFQQRLPLLRDCSCDDLRRDALVNRRLGASKTSHCEVVRVRLPTATPFPLVHRPLELPRADPEVDDRALDHQAPTFRQENPCRSCLPWTCSKRLSVACQRGRGRRPPLVPGERPEASWPQGRAADVQDEYAPRSPTGGRAGQRRLLLRISLRHRPSRTRSPRARQGPPVAASPGEGRRSALPSPREQRGSTRPAWDGGVGCS